jgi:hypothetical protein
MTQTTVCQLGMMSFVEIENIYTIILTIAEKFTHSISNEFLIALYD